MTYSIRIVDIRSYDAVQISATYGYWHNPIFMLAVAEMHKLIPLQLQVFKGEELFAVLPLYERSKMGVRALVSPVGAYYQGICFAFEENAGKARIVLDTVAVCTEISQFLTKRYKRIHIKLNPQNYDVRGFTWNGFKAFPLYTFRYHVGESLPSLADERKKYRTAQKHDMRMEERFDPDAFMRLQKDLDLRKKHELGISYSRLKEFFIRLYSEQLLKQFNIIWQNEVVSANILLYDGGDVAYTLFKATAEKALRKGAATFHSINLLEELPLGTKLFDYCGANVPEVARFKAAIGLDLCSFYQIKI
ncbi:MAG: hypothetical protein PHY41_04755 [Candidatus Cloacimonetes bacterium]|nr:hypothetical protein [Candidatus Cloacimonadota bacterium]MDD4686843.1 hypothetical protein [Candidatus Cloacimonadota bacterium]